MTFFKSRLGMALALACALMMLPLACGSGSRSTAPTTPTPVEPEVRYLPLPAQPPCLAWAPPESPRPPETCPADLPDCDLFNLYQARLLDHLEVLERWARIAWLICGRQP